MGGDFETGRALVAEEVAAYEEVGNEHAAIRAAADGFGAIELADDPASAEEYLRAELAALDAIGETGHLSSIAGQLASALGLQGRSEESLHFSKVGEKLAREAVNVASETDDLTTRASAYLVLAEVLGEQDRFTEGSTAAKRAMRPHQEKGNLVAAGKALLLLRELEPELQP
jgi:hypothetical protein